MVKKYLQMRFSDPRLYIGLISSTIGFFILFTTGLFGVVFIIIGYFNMTSWMFNPYKGWKEEYIKEIKNDI